MQKNMSLGSREHRKQYSGHHVSDPLWVWADMLGFGTLGIIKKTELRENGLEVRWLGIHSSKFLSAICYIIICSPLC